jgi:hypothetical protein
MQYFSSSTVESAGDYSSKELRCLHIPDKKLVKSMVRFLFFPINMSRIRDGVRNLLGSLNVIQRFLIRNKFSLVALFCQLRYFFTSFV